MAAGESIDFIQDGKLNVRRFRHRIAAALVIVNDMIAFSERDSARRAEYIATLRKALKRIGDANDALASLNCIADLTEVSDDKKA